MVKKIVWGVGKTGKETISVFVLIIVEVRDGFHIEEFVKEPTSSPPPVSIAKDRNVPRAVVHPLFPVSRRSVRKSRATHSSSIGTVG